MKELLIGLAKKISSNELATRALHTFLQAFVAALLVSLASVHDLNTAKAVILAAVAAGLSAAKTAVLQSRG